MSCKFMNKNVHTYTFDLKCIRFLNKMYPFTKTIFTHKVLTHFLHRPMWPLFFN